MGKKTTYCCIVATFLGSSLFFSNPGFGQQSDHRIPINTEVLTTVGKAKLGNLRDLLRDNLASKFVKEKIKDKVGLGLFIVLEETLQTFREYVDKERKTRLSTDAAILAITLLRADNNNISPGQVNSILGTAWPVPPAATPASLAYRKDRQTAAFAEVLYLIDEGPAAIQGLVDLVESLPLNDRNLSAKKILGKLSKFMAGLSNLRANWGTREAEMEWIDSGQGTTLAESYNRIEILHHNGRAGGGAPVLLANLKMNSIVGKLKKALEKTTTVNLLAVLGRLATTLNTRAGPDSLVNVLFKNLGSQILNSEKSLEEKLLIYIKETKPFTTYFNRHHSSLCGEGGFWEPDDNITTTEQKTITGKVISGRGSVVCQNVLLLTFKLIEGYPEYVSFTANGKEFDKSGYVNFAVDATRQSLTIFPNWNFYASIGLTRTSDFDMSSEDICTVDGLYCNATNLLYFHEKFGFQYRPRESDAIPLRILGKSYPIFLNLYVGGILFKPQVHDTFTKANDVDNRYIIGAELGIFPENTVEINVGYQKLLRKNGTAPDINVLYLNLSIPLEEYLTTAAK